MSLCILMAPTFAILQDLLNFFYGVFVIVGVNPPDLFVLVGPLLGCP